MCTFNPSCMNSRRRAGVGPARFLLVLCALMVGGASATAQQSSEDEDGRTAIETNLVGVNVSVTDADGRALSTLDQTAFSVYDNGRKQEVAFFSRDDAPASVAVLFDLSGSISTGKMEQARAALRRFFENSHPDDEYFLIGFNGEPRVLLSRTRKAEAVVEQISQQRAGGQTALYDACRLAVKQLSRSAHRRRAILLISDGQDNDSRSTLRGLHNSLREDDVVIYALGINDHVELASVRGRAGRNALEEITRATGGRALFPRSPEEMTAACERIALELRSFYQIAYRPDAFAADGKWRRIRVKVTPPAGGARVFVRHKEGYYARPKGGAL
jgi:Ca-activated chloride channel homolog